MSLLAATRWIVTYSADVPMLHKVALLLTRRVWLEGVIYPRALCKTSYLLCDLGNTEGLAWKSMMMAPCRHSPSDLRSCPRGTVPRLITARILGLTPEITCLHAAFVFRFEQPGGGLRPVIQRAFHVAKCHDGCRRA